MLRKIRIFLAAIFFIGILLLFFAAGTFISADYISWIGEIQLVPAIMALSIGLIAIILILTLLFGRVYCSTICPMGVLQDIIIWISRKMRKNKFIFSNRHFPLRIIIFLIFIVALVFVPSWASLIEPYSMFGRILTICQLALPTLIIAILTLLIIAHLAFWHGRWYCNNICPVGTLLGAIGIRSLLRIRIDTTKCNHCGNCEKNCKASCINSKEQKILYSHCVACMDCIDKCKKGAIKFSLAPKKSSTANNKHSELTNVDNSRRAFLAGVGALGAGYVMAKGEKIAQAALATDGKTTPERTTPLRPAGSVSNDHFAKHCTACQLCVNVCPQNVLVPSGRLADFMQPEMNFSNGYCDIDCNRCSEICPANAILPITLEAKTAMQIGHAVTYHQYCQSCGKCEEICPAGAISMIDYNGKQIPVVDEEYCIGCGACEYHCSANPVKAILVAGHQVHKEV